MRKYICEIANVTLSSVTEIQYLIKSLQAVVDIILRHAPWLANEQSWSGWTPLHSAAVMGHTQVVDLLLNSEANARWTGPLL